MTIMATDKRHKILNAPNLRFPGFSGEWKESLLQDVATLSKGAGISKDQLSKEGNPCILYGELYTKYNSEVITEIYSRTNVDLKNLVLSKKNDVITPSSGETAIDISTARCVPFDNIFLGGDLNIIRLNGHDGRFLSYQLNGVRRLDIAKVAQGVSVVHLYGENLRRLKVRFPRKEEQEKIAAFMTVIDARIQTQIGAIEDYKKLKGYLIDELIEQRGRTMKIGDVIAQRTERNRKNDDYTVLSVNNQKGFIAQSEQFEEREVASEDKSNYKIVRRDDFAYNPARINVGSIARLSNYDCGIVSPMYICFHSDERVLPEFLGYFFESRYFATEVDKRLEGSVRLCLSYDGLCDISIQIPNVENQQAIIQKLDAVSQKIALEEQCLDLFKQQKAYLLKNMFV
jgi:type I restriction enzyme S subunit